VISSVRTCTWSGYECGNTLSRRVGESGSPEDTELERNSVATPRIEDLGAVVGLFEEAPGGGFEALSDQEHAERIEAILERARQRREMIQAPEGR
jgi:hypothetical protein